MTSNPAIDFLVDYVARGKMSKHDGMAIMQQMLAIKPKKKKREFKPATIPLKQRRKMLAKALRERNA